MAKTLKKTGLTSKHVFNPKYIFITPFTDGTTEGDVTYQVEEIVRGTTNVTQEDSTENKVENELSSSPIINNITAGGYTVSTEIADLQADLLKDLLGFSVDASNKKVYAPEGYVTKYAKFALVFQDSGGKYCAAILPKVQVNPKVVFDSLDTSLGRITLTGSGFNMTVDSKQTPFFIDFDYTLPVGG